jgi:hypothetical protein
MVIKSQQDIKNENKAKADKVPKSMEGKLIPKELNSEKPVSQKPSNPTSGANDPVSQKSTHPVSSVNERLDDIEEYLLKVDKAFEAISEELVNVKTFVKIMQDMDAEISKLTGDIIRVTKINEDRYIELATAVNIANEKIETLDKYIPVFVDNKLKNYFEELSQEDPSQEDSLKPK